MSVPTTINPYVASLACPTPIPAIVAVQHSPLLNNYQNRMPIRARCVWSKSELARQTCSQQLNARGGKESDDEYQTGPRLSMIF